MKEIKICFDRLNHILENSTTGRSLALITTYEVEFLSLL